MFELHDFARSSSAYRVRIALALKGLTHNRLAVDLLRGEQHEAEFRALNPQGLVPVYSDGSIHLSQSLAIIEYLEECHPEPSLLPETPRQRARARQIANLIASDIQPLNGFRVLLYLRDTLGVDVQRRRQWFQHWLLEGLDALELWLVADNRRQSFCVGDRPSIADICVVPQIDLARRNNIDIDDFPRLAAIEAACMARPEFRDTHPDAVAAS